MLISKDISDKPRWSTSDYSKRIQQENTRQKDEKTQPENMTTETNEIKTTLPQSTRLVW